tara:strand:- start:4941 stop:5525 length:585 start_codon:yes stop_codon:yes gene_type:complete
MKKEYEKYLDTENYFNFQDFYTWISEKDYMKTFVEVGVWKGHSVCYLGDKLRHKLNQQDVNLYAIDLFDETYKYEDNPHILKQKPHLYDIFKKNVKNADLTDKIKDIKSCSWDAASKFENQSVDFLFIDADHSYESVIKDITAWMPKMKFPSATSPGGIISGHDYYNPCGVKQAVDESFGSRVKHMGAAWYVEL